MSDRRVTIADTRCAIALPLLNDIERLYPTNPADSTACVQEVSELAAVLNRSLTLQCQHNQLCLIWNSIRILLKKDFLGQPGVVQPGTLSDKDMVLIVYNLANHLTILYQNHLQTRHNDSDQLGFLNKNNIKNNNKIADRNVPRALIQYIDCLREIVENAVGINIVEQREGAVALADFRQQAGDEGLAVRFGQLITTVNSGLIKTQFNRVSAEVERWVRQQRVQLNVLSNKAFMKELDKKPGDAASLNQALSAFLQGSAVAGHFRENHETNRR